LILKGEHTVRGTIAITNYDWYDKLRAESPLDEVNFWKPSATRTFHAEPFTPFLFNGSSLPILGKGEQFPRVI